MASASCPITGTEVTPRRYFPRQSFSGLLPKIPATGEFSQMLQKVTHRNPVPFQPHKHVPEYLLCYVIETLACGHQVTIYPQADSLVAVRRDCQQCGGTVPKKKPYSVVSVRSEVHKTA